MAVFKKGYVKLILLLLLVLCAALVSLNIFLNQKLGTEAPAYLEEFAGKLGYKIRYDGASFDPLFRLRVKGLGMYSPDGGKTYAEIGGVTVSPSIISSIFGRRISIGDVYVEEPVVRYDSEAADRLMNLIKGDGGEGGVSVEVERVRLRDAVFEVSPDFVLTSKSMNVLIVKRSGERDYDEVHAAGDINVKGVDTEISGSVMLRSGETDGKFVLTAGKLSGIPIPDEDGGEHADVSARAEIEFRAAATVKSSGSVTLSAADDNKEAPRLAELGYILDFDSDAGVVSFEKLGFDVLGVLTGNFNGEIRDVTGDAVFDLAGSSGEGNLSNIVKRLPWLDADRISGRARALDLKITGSLKKNDLALAGKLLVENAGFEYGDGVIDVRGLGCALDVSQALGSPFTHGASGKCSAESVGSSTAGEMKDVSTGVRAAARESFNNAEFKLENLNAKYLGGGISGSLGLDVSGGKSGLSGKIAGQNLDLSKIPEGLVPLDIGGSAESLSADFKGSEGEYGVDVSFVVNGLEINLGEGRNFNLSKAATGAPVRVEYTSGAAEAGGGAPEPHRKISVKDKSLSYENLSFADYFIERGQIEDLGFAIDLGGDWALEMNSRGSGFRVLGMDAALGSFREHLVINDSGRNGFSGTIEGGDGVFNGIELPAISAEYDYKGDSVDIRAVEAQISTIGVFTSERAGVVFGKGQGGYPYEINFSGGVFSAINDRIKSEGMTGRFTILDSSKNEKGWEGVIKSPSTTITSETIENLSLNISPAPEGVSISGISGRLRGGELGGKVDILTSGERTGLAVNIGLDNAVIKSGTRDIPIRSARINYSGQLVPGSLPEGGGRIELNGLTVPDGTGQTILQAGLDAATSGETLSVREGFIRDSEGTTLRVEGEMDNILSGPIRTGLSMPEVSLKSLSRLVAPFAPPSVRDARLDGSAAMRAEFVNLFSPEMSWKGDVTLKNASYDGYMGGALLSVRGINGSVTIKESGTAENPLAAFLDTGLELGRDVYNRYHKSLRDAPPPAGELDHLRIGEIEYGILKFQNVQCELEADNEKLTIARLVSDFFGGRLYGTGLFDYGGGKSAYNFSFLFNDVSLQGISRRLSPVQEYITGRMNGLIWLTGEGGELGTINGPFEFWSVSSPKEQRTIGKALLDQLGAKERLILGSNRSYDTGEISGYINDGVITFKKLEISNSILGFKNLSIQSDPIRNSISIAHFVSVIREIARRSQSGGPTIETN